MPDWPAETEYPLCPDCETDRWVEGCPQAADWQCLDCGRQFDGDETSPVPWGARR
jgi:tRNA(Ile2) C34 agmatinyltransferase TiaS